MCTLKALSAALLACSSVTALPKIASVQHPPKPVVRHTNSTAGPRLSFLAPLPEGRVNIFASLTADEAAGVVEFLHAQTELNLTAYDTSGTRDNWIRTVDLVYPDKAAALAYLDGDGPAPPRYAKVAMRFQVSDEPYAEEWLVGPLPIAESSTAVPYTAISTKDSSRIKIYTADYDLMNDFARARCDEAEDIITDLLGASHAEFDLWGPDALPDADTGRTILWLGFWGRPSNDDDAQTILPQGLYLMLDVTGRDASQYALKGWLYNGAFYTSTDEFRAAWSAEGFEKPSRNAVEGSESWVSTDRKGAEIPLDTTLPPIQDQPGEKRFTVDEQGYVEWGDFSFLIGFTRDTGVRLFDIRFRGQRIIYELGLDEAIAHYSGADPVQAGTAYLDSYYGFGALTDNLWLGYDVPAYAICIPAIYHDNEMTTTHQNAICLFEADQNYLMQRHSTSGYVSATKNVALMLRAVSTIGNYDYTFDYIFSRDGSLEIVVKASGYIQSAYFAKNEEFGYRIHDGLSGSMHDHVLTFKIDLDILGTANTLLKHSVVAGTVELPWSTKPRSMMRLVKETIKNEDEGKLAWPMNGEAMYVVANTDAPNAFGESPGYLIRPGSRGVSKYLTIQQSDVLFNSQSFATNAFYVAQRKESEPMATHSLNTFDTRDPIVDFNSRFNGESLEQQDLVLHVNLGMSHVPVAEDLPNTVMTTAQSAFILAPHNYFAENPSASSSQTVRVNLADDGTVADVNYFGAEGYNSASTIDMYQASTNERSFGFEGDGADTMST